MSTKKRYCVLGFSSHLGDPLKGNQHCKKYVNASNATHAAEIAFKNHMIESFVYLRQVGKKQIKIYKGKLNSDPTRSYERDGSSKIKYPFKVKRVFYHSKGSKGSKGSKIKKSQQTKGSQPKRSKKSIKRRRSLRKSR